MKPMTIICADSLKWLPQHRDQGAIVTSIHFEQSQSISAHRNLLIAGATECFLSVSKACPVVFMNTDTKRGGRWFSKSYVLMRVAKKMGFKLLWHKIELRRGIGKIDFFRPTYRNLLAFGDNKVKVGKATPDVIPHTYNLYPDSNGIASVVLAIRFCMRHTDHFLDPFCGRGVFPFIANRLGAVATGVDIDEAQCKATRTLLEQTKERDSLVQNLEKCISEGW
jgi:hypothetical protein